MADQINPGAFRVMCDMFGVDDAVKNAKRMGVTRNRRSECLMTIHEKDRLISANELQQHFTDMQHYEPCAGNFIDNRGEPSTNWLYVEMALENAPTVDAIPVSFLQEAMSKLALAYQNKEAEHIQFVLWLWDKKKNADGTGDNDAAGKP